LVNCLIFIYDNNKFGAGGIKNILTCTGGFFDWREIEGKALKKALSSL
jgi:hypothetical protein